MREIKDLLDAATTAAAQAAAYLRRAVPLTKDPTRWTQKGQHDFVSEADRGAEALIADVLMKRVPGSKIIGEELSPQAAREGDIVWFVDPLDGTTNFLHGYPQYAVSIGCMMDGSLVAGVVHDVPRDAVYRGSAGNGAWLGERRLSVSNVREPQFSLVGTGFPFKRLEDTERYLRQFRTVMQASSGIRRAGSAALDLADVAAGRLDAFWELTLSPWDVAAGVVLIREAGGVVTTNDGSPDVLYGKPIIAGNPTLYRWLLEVVQQS